MRTMPFGKHRGQPLDEVPLSYLGWLLEGADFLGRYRGLREAIEDEIRERVGPRWAPPPRPVPWQCPEPGLARELVAAGRRAMALRHHPDRGGDTEQMKRTNVVADWLDARLVG